MRSPKAMQCNVYNTLHLTDKLTHKSYNVCLHRLVAHKHVGGHTDEKHIVHHIDENKRNNHFKNLQWTTPKLNNRYYFARRRYVRPKQLKRLNIWSSMLSLLIICICNN